MLYLINPPRHDTVLPWSNSLYSPLFSSLAASFLKTFTALHPFRCWSPFFLSHTSELALPLPLVLQCPLTVSPCYALTFVIMLVCALEECSDPLSSSTLPPYSLFPFYSCWSSNVSMGSSESRFLWFEAVTLISFFLYPFPWLAGFNQPFVHDPSSSLRLTSTRVFLWIHALHIIPKLFQLHFLIPSASIILPLYNSPASPLGGLSSLSLDRISFITT